MKKQGEKAGKGRPTRQSDPVADPRPKPQAPPVKLPKTHEGFLNLVEHPLVLLGLLVIGGALGVLVFAPILVVCEASILLALHGSKVLQGKRQSYQIAAYTILFLLTAPLVLAVGIYVRKPARDSFHEVVTQNAAKAKAPEATAPPTPSPNQNVFAGGLLSPPMYFPPAQPAPGRQPSSQEPSEPPESEPPPNSAEAALIRQMREKLTRDAGDPQKISVDVQWMRDQFEQGWAQEPPDLARKHREETEQTARLILAVASNRDAILKLLPRITIDK